MVKIKKQTTKDIGAEETIKIEGDTTKTIETPKDLEKIEDTIPFADSVRRRKVYGIDWDTVPSTSKARAYNTGNQTIVSGTPNKLAMNTESYDVNGEFDHATNFRFTAIYAGYYAVFLNISWAEAMNNKTCYALIYKNGVSHAQTRFRANVDFYLDQQVSDIIYLAAGNYIEGYALQDSGTNKTINQGTASTFIAIHRLS